MNQINWTQVAVFGLVALLVFLVGGGCLVLLLAGTAGGGMMMGGYGPGWGGGQGACPWCGQPTGGYGPSSGGMMPGMGGYNPFGFLWPIFGLLVMGAVVGIPILLVLLLVGLLAWLVRGTWQSPPASGEEE